MSSARGGWDEQSSPHLRSAPAPGNGARNGSLAWGEDKTTTLARQTRSGARAGAAQTVLLTGATGFLGMRILADLLEHTDARVLALVRGANEREATARIAQRLKLLFGTTRGLSGRVRAIRGDVTLPDLGLGRRRLHVAERTQTIIHSAATVAFDTDIVATRAINVEGTRNVLRFAELCDERGGLRRLAHVSTAYVAGDHSGVFSEDDLCVGQSFRNPYERSKFEAERLIAAWRERLPITVLRPSIIVGERATGWTVAFNVLYWPLRTFSNGAYTIIPARAQTLVDIVPVDYVSAGVVELAMLPEAEGFTFHLTAAPHATTIGEIAELASAFFERPAPRFIEPAIYSRALHPILTRLVRDKRTRRALQRSELFFPYFNASVRFDNRRARVALKPAGIEPSPLREYFDALMRFAIGAQWGKRELPRPLPRTFLRAAPRSRAPRRKSRA
jgi:thioester reductase-like protein